MFLKMRLMNTSEANEEMNPQNSATMSTSSTYA